MSSANEELIFDCRVIALSPPAAAAAALSRERAVPSCFLSVVAPYWEDYVTVVME